MMLKGSIGEGEYGNASEYQSELFSHWRFPFTGSFRDQRSLAKAHARDVGKRP
jgi:hypothetical protein